ncbi:hypothetical protein GA0074696_0045 [Micromonospora purpureochromogenes]|uniref:Uncharacterized protein n=1 Tax=Micromonospora purpureochromogenes TaxID=47872 RepID=A0A1C4U1J4_9ACTN|nr:hypothetical protein [Micromonospora purpureochromogenes]SCE65573.1 hypothetical protein GA0074696_0045 [Micromonospora purpureochromogenes]
MEQSPSVGERGAAGVAARGESSSREAQWWSEHRVAQLALALTLIPAVVAAVRVYVVSNGDEVVLKSVAASLNVQALMLGTYLPVLPMILIVAGFTALSRSGTQLRERFGDSQALTMIYGTMLVGLLLLDLIYAIAIAVLFLLELNALRRRWIRANRERGAGQEGQEDREAWRKRIRNDLKGLLFQIEGPGGRRAALLAIGLLLVMWEGMWLPANVIGLKGKAWPETAFIIGQTDELTTLLYEDSAAVRTVPTADVVTRIPCGTFIKLSEALGRPVYTYFFPLTVKPKPQPRCDEIVEKWPGRPK